jgi:hypothetical protein
MRNGGAPEDPGAATLGVMPSTVEPTRATPLRRLVASLSQSKSDQEAADLRGGVRDRGYTPICECLPGQAVTVTGGLRSVTLRPHEGVPAVEAEVYDGSGRILVVWLGRRRIRGIEAGRGIVVTGRITCTSVKPTIYNPRYTVLPPTRSEA